MWYDTWQKFLQIIAHTHSDISIYKQLPIYPLKGLLKPRHAKCIKFIPVFMLITITQQKDCNNVK